MESTTVGLKLGSQNTAVARRNGDGIETKVMKTCVRYPKTLTQKQTVTPIVGDAAAIFADAKYPLNLGVIETDEGKQQVKDILNAIDIIPDSANIGIASPAMEIKGGGMRLAEAVKETFHPATTILFSEALCSAVTILFNAGHIKDPQELKTRTILSANLGSSTFEFGCFSEASTTHLSAHSEICGDLVDSAIMTKISNRIGDAMITRPDVRNMKEHASLIKPVEFMVKGQSRSGIVEQPVCEEVTGPIRDYVIAVCETIKAEIKTINPQVRKAALETPLVISGGMANIHGLGEFMTEVLTEKLNFPIQTVYAKDGNSHIAPAIGAMLICEAVITEEGEVQ